MNIEFNFPSCNSFLSQMAYTSMTILSQDLFRMSFLVHQAELQLMVFFQPFIFHEICVILIVLTLYKWI